jgi:hypothetical protein
MIHYYLFGITILYIAGAIIIPVIEQLNATVRIRRRSSLFVIAGGGRVMRPPAVTKRPCATS